MVKTRHSGEPDEGEDDEFVSLPTRRTRKNRTEVHMLNGYDSSEHDDESPQRESRSRRRQGSHREVKDEQKTDTDTAEEEETPPRQREQRGSNRRSTRKASVKDYHEEEEEEEEIPRKHRQRRQPAKHSDQDDEDEDESPPRSSRRRARGTVAVSRCSRQSERSNTHASSRSTRLHREPSPDDFEDVVSSSGAVAGGRYSGRNGRRRYRESVDTPATTGRSSRDTAATHPDTDNSEDDDNHNVVRRSGRQRKLMYSTFNQNTIDKHISFLTQEELDPEEEQRPRKRRRREVDVEDLAGDGIDADLDIYTRVKRVRRVVKRDMYGMPITEGEDTQGSATETSQGEEEEEEEEEKNRSYNLREHKPRTIHYQAPAYESQGRKQRGVDIFRGTSPAPVRRSTRRVAKPQYTSPARRKTGSRRRRAFHGSDSTSSSSSSSGAEDNDERRFERRKAKSMLKSRQRCLPMNFEPNDVAAGAVRDRQKIGASLADIDPMSVDRQVTFDSVGGLGKHVQKLKEMIVFPLLYPEVFERFKITPPRGCLFYGPPGTGKTLVARALANECSHGDKKVAFFMRKGADCLSKWVGESERQLRMLFDQAYQTRPSIIFFDEIDGLAPVRSSRQDQIHSSIVSTLLALMDGLDNRGEIVVIGATNRIDSIDPALRRPGRFDREFLFPLPSLEARQQILRIHTKAWNPALTAPFLRELSTHTVGYCGADLKSLCTEAALNALRRRYPQIYHSKDKLQLDVTSINISAKDFHLATQGIVPAHQRSETSPGRALTPAIRPLMAPTLVSTLRMVQKLFPSVLAEIASIDTPPNEEGSGELELYSDSEDEASAMSIYQTAATKSSLPPAANAEGDATNNTTFLNYSHSAFSRPVTYRPRMLLAGEPGQGQSTHVGPAILHHLERMPVHTLDLPALFAVTAKSPEESCAQIFREARRTSPSIIYMPHVNEWWEVIGDACRATFLTILQDMDPSTPTLLLATADTQHHKLHFDVASLFDVSAGEVMIMQNPTDSQRRNYFEDLLLVQATKAPTTKKKAAERALEVLPVAPPPVPRELSESEKTRLYEQEEATMREMRLFLRDCLNKLGRDRKFGLFAKPVDEEDVPDYYEIITKAMDLSTMMSKIDLHKYETVGEFMDDIDLICKNALEYNPDTDVAGRAIRHRACALKDTAQSILTAELDQDFEKLCDEIKKSRARRGESPKKNVPAYYFTKPLNTRARRALGGDLPSAATSKTSVGQEATSTAPADLDASTENPDQDTSRHDEDFITVDGMVYFKYYKRIKRKRNTISLAKRSPWCRPSKHTYRRVLYLVDEQGIEYPADEIMPAEDNTGTEDEEEEGEKKVAKKEEEDAESSAHAAATTSTGEDSKPVKAASDEPNTAKATTSTVHRDSDESSGVVTLKNRLPPPVSTTTGVLPRRTRSNSPRVAIPSHGMIGPLSITPPPAAVYPSTSRSTARPSSVSPASRSGRSTARPSSVSPTSRGGRSTTRPSSVSPASRSGRHASLSPRGSTRRSSATPTTVSTTTTTRGGGRQPSPAAQHPTTSSHSPAQHNSKCRRRSNSSSSSKTPVKCDKNGSATHQKQGETEEAMDTSNATAPMVNGDLSSECSKDDSLPGSSSTKNGAAAEEEVPAASSPARPRMTRAKAAAPAVVQKALAVLNSHTPDLVIDTTRLHALVDKVVTVTRGYSVEQLERVFSTLSQTIFHFRREYDRTHMIHELEQAIQRFSNTMNPAS